MCTASSRRRLEDAAWDLRLTSEIWPRRKPGKFVVSESARKARASESCTAPKQKCASFTTLGAHLILPFSIRRDNERRHDGRADRLRRLARRRNAKEPNKLRPYVVVEDHTLFDESFPNVLIVPLTDSSDFLIPSLTVAIDPSPENGCTKRSHAISHSITVASKQRVLRPPSSRITAEQLGQIRAQIAECIGLTSSQT
jgi:mRNA interferase MazF